MRKIPYLLITALITLLLSGCSLEPPSWAKTGGKKDLNHVKLGLSMSTLNNPFFVYLKDMVVQEADKQGFEVIVVDAQNDPAKQNNDVDDLLQKGVNALLINPTDSSAISAAVQNANAIGIPVITIDRSADKGEVASLIASDNVGGGKMAAQYIIDSLGEGAVVAELEGIPGTSAARERGEGFHSLADSKLNVVVKQAADFDRTKGLNVMENLLQANPNIQAVFAQNDEMALGAVEAVASSGKNIVVIGFDGSADALRAIKEGKLSATIAQQFDLIGQKAVQTAADILRGKPVEKYVPVAIKLVTKDNQ
ncbi:MAG: ribose ABC transporter substrate-binding protein RbsB [Paenibacillus macerans]|uniref:Ribose ABC transporter substrate-binding protein RbsB n=1 Tax=Paenibacillus macerans TaxID=44252 RepID=A0A6N8EZJ7_PAEMA|nr:ribose ABC transporter substrate-binding protein RbsB [Paenibacillus macerans]MBS5911602.1 ribose ABC transporter substrate-binding protein RbsB [Paenibacillus macerans]MDU7473247.1 ribose ABC transporter substrate-binding protein RbsB [Paenibacillus macerans]MEC0136056.1 ribose ABC transporter substrate-binding protein RbsB [Paenibacillus macerans]MEC0332469.1 ribose ABC transporter substrate-binding protein RbsB [Paenibacillus macerans]MUG24183.1 ribose ABC transporter substrate-binding p